MPMFVFADMDQPTLHVGDNWTYDLSMFQLGLEFTGEMITEMEGQTSSHGHTVYILSLDGSGTVESAEGSGSFEMWGHEHMRTSDLADVELNMSLRIDLTVGESEITTWVYTEQVYDPPNNRWDFPIAVGDEWISISEVTETFTMRSLQFDETTEDTYTTQMNYTCESIETLNVPAGSFSSYKIKEEMEEGYGYWYVSPDVGLIVKMESYNETEELIMTYELKSYSYTPGNGNGGNGDGGTDEGIVGLLMDNILWIIIIIVIVVVIAVAGVAMSRRGRLPPEEEVPEDIDESEQPPPE
ncbi:MAG: hypothetical protein JSV43_05600 [Methanobacteriota archaeon]|nr:MAG: hypothetical protein JSV43_05600 [Euryarchaeota archaeon]